MKDEKVLELLESINETLGEIRDTFASMAEAFASVAEEDAGNHQEPQDGNMDALTDAINRLATGGDEPSHGITAWGKSEGWDTNGN